jgi:hypothetical protein
MQTHEFDFWLIDYVRRGLAANRCIGLRAAEELLIYLIGCQYDYRPTVYENSFV